ncbi:hypothetical protein [Salinirussus salinus]|jgi:hypothetical protein|uniref:hypothetical protein n=1 Tax=Salinirussus salinus TaxID=1198300 RepID=UPI001356B59D|nr:hypothetical protein [Salinirussus salinus]
MEQYTETELEAAIRDVNGRVDGLLTESKYKGARDSSHPTKETIHYRTESFAIFLNTVLEEIE